MTDLRTPGPTWAERLAAVRAEMAAKPVFPAPAPMVSRTIGCSAYSSTISTPDGFPAGGTIVEVLDIPDALTGELVRRYRTVALSGRQLDWHLLGEDDVAEAVPGRRTDIVIEVICALLREVAMDGARLRKRLTPAHITLIGYARTLAGVL